MARLDGEDAKFEPGEVAVLLNSVGGRLFVVGRQDKDPPYRVWEEKRSPNSFALDAHPVNLVKVRNRDDAVSLVAILDYLYGARRQEEDRIRNEFEAEVRRAAGVFRMVEGLE